jgi:hypothetical protein
MRSLFFSVLAAAAVYSFIVQTVLAQTQPRISADAAQESERPLFSSSVDEIASEFDGARESFLNIDGGGAAVRIRRAAINRSVVELESLTRAIEQRSLSSVRPLDEAFARANFALANSYLLLAIRAQNQQARQRIGEELNSAVGHFQQGSRRLGRNLRKDEQELVQNTRTLARNLIHGAGLTADEIGQGIQSFGQRLEQVQTTDSAAQIPPTSTGIVR